MQSASYLQIDLACSCHLNHLNLKQAFWVCKLRQNRVRPRLPHRRNNDFIFMEGYSLVLLDLHGFCLVNFKAFTLPWYGQLAKDTCLELG